MSTNAHDEKIKAVLLDAAKLVERGWCQGYGARIIDGRGYYCATAAIYAVAANVLQWNEAAYAVRRHLGLDSNTSLSVWNDAPERTQADVVAAFRGAAEGLDSTRSIQLESPDGRTA